MIKNVKVKYVQVVGRFKIGKEQKIGRLSLTFYFNVFAHYKL